MMLYVLAPIACALIGFVIGRETATLNRDKQRRHNEAIRRELERSRGNHPTGGQS